jgi:hypothetical protein
MYDKLRQLCLGDDMRKDYPDWPYPLLFHGHEITRNIFFLDPLIEYQVIKLGRNQVLDAASLEYRSLNRWFHYEFFYDGMSHVGNSAETATLLPRLVRLRKVLLEDFSKDKMAKYLEREFSVSDTTSLISSMIFSIEQMISICSRHRLVVWGSCMNEEAAAEQASYITGVLSKIPMNLVLDLPHFKERMKKNKQLLLEEEILMQKAEAKYNKLRNHKGGSPEYLQNSSAP